MVLIEGEAGIGKTRLVAELRAELEGVARPVDLLAVDLWEDPPEGAVGSIRTFVGALRRALEPDQPPRTPPSLIVTVGTGYALRAAVDDVDAWRFEQAVEAVEPPARLLAELDSVLSLWRGPAYAEFGEAPWALSERTRLSELRLRAVERRAQALLDLGRAAEAMPGLDAHAQGHPWREEAWRLLALALYRSGRQADARLRLEATVGLMRGLAVTGPSGLLAAREHRAGAVEVAEELGDADLVARVIGAYDVPANWTRSDDPAQAHRVVTAAERTLVRLLPDTAPGVRARLPATIAIESRGGAVARGGDGGRADRPRHG
ncbi:BTAD domain-containing putative transcriptional regulator [Nonomuraea cavernae]